MTTLGAEDNKVSGTTVCGLWRFELCRHEIRILTESNKKMSVIKEMIIYRIS